MLGDTWFKYGVVFFSALFDPYRFCLGRPEPQSATCGRNTTACPPLTKQRNMVKPSMI